MSSRFCTLKDCDGVHAGRGLCQKHLARLHKYGDPTKYANTDLGECPKCQPPTGSVANRPPKDFICDDCLDRFQRWLRDQKERYGDSVLVVQRVVS